MPPLMPPLMPLALLALLALAGAGAAPPASAQVADAALGGRVVDDEGVGIAGARVFARHRGTKVRRTVVADARGLFRFPPLPAGVWDVEAAADGYTVAVIGKVGLPVAQSRRLDLVLERTDGQEMVSLVDYPPLATVGPDVTLGFERDELATLPLRSRSKLELLALDPFADPAQAPSVRLDGGSVDAVQTAAVLPLSAIPLSALDQVAVLSPTFDVAVGGSSVVSLLTRSGGDARRGSAFALYRDQRLDASTDRLHVGASIGGPLARGRSHLFVAGETVDEGGAASDSDGRRRQALVVRGDRHDARNLLHWRYVGLDSSRSSREHSWLLGWQTLATDRLVHALRAQATQAGDRDRLLVRSDVYVAVARRAGGLHDLKFGAESQTVSTAKPHVASSEIWALYLGDRWQLGDRLTWTVGVRSEFADTEPVNASAPLSWQPTWQSDTTERSTERLAPRFGWTWRLSDDGEHLVRGGAGRFLEAHSEVDQFTLGWSWQPSPFLGLTLDAVAVAPRDDAAVGDSERMAVTVRSRFSDTFQIRASYTWTDASSGVSRDRAVVTGIYRAPADVVLAAVYRSKALPAEAGASADTAGLDLRVAKRLPVHGELSVEVLAEVFDLFEESPVAEPAGGRVGQLGLRLGF